MKYLTWKRVVLLGVLCAGAWLALHAIRARSGLVTLEAQDEDLQKVVHQIQWQTWQRVLVHRGVRAKVSVDFKKTPLPQALAVLAQQAHCRFQVLYPLYSTQSSLRKFKQAAEGEVEPVQAAWSNVLEVVHPVMPPRPDDEGLRADEPITLNVTNKELRLVSLALTRFANVLMVPEDGTLNQLSVNLNSSPVPEAMQTLAKTVFRRTRSYYSLLPGMGPTLPGPDGRPPEMAEGPLGPPPDGGPPPGGPDGGPPGGPGGPPPPGAGPPRMQPPTKEAQQKMEQDFQALMDMLPPSQGAALAGERQAQSAMQQQGGGGQPGAQQSQGKSSSSSVERAQGLRRSTAADRVNRDRGGVKGK
jgi:hypothetical protein